MALPHARPFDVIAVRPLGDGLTEARSTSLIRTARLQLLHLVLRAHEDLPPHHVDDECTIHCLEGTVEIETGDGTRRLDAGQLVLLPAGLQHAVRARSDATVLVTLRLLSDAAGTHGSADDAS